LHAAVQQLKANEQALQKSEEELRKKVAELERFNKLMVGRELEMVKLKEQINSLHEELGRPKKYDAPGRAKGL
jgi:predicted  nucleic acid-binding Zn-ribbon protein